MNYSISHATPRIDMWLRCLANNFTVFSYLGFISAIAKFKGRVMSKYKYFYVYHLKGVLDPYIPILDSDFLHFGIKDKKFQGLIISCLQLSIQPTKQERKKEIIC
jgi:hypothetical protein